MVDEGAACSCPEVTIFECVVDQDVAIASVATLVGRQAGDDPRARKMLGGPAHLLRGGPISAGKPG
jgi:hypothetical protein